MSIFAKMCWNVLAPLIPRVRRLYNVAVYGIYNIYMILSASDSPLSYEEDAVQLLEIGFTAIQMGN